MDKQFLASDGTRLVYDDLGPAHGQVVVLCHGLAAAARQFAADADFLAGLGYRVLVPDLRGHGRSASPRPLRPAALAMPRFAADMRELLDHTGASAVHWVGNSLGGIIALAMLGDDRLASLATFGTTYAIHLPRVGGHHLITASQRLLGQEGLAAITAMRTTRDPAARRLIESILRDARHDVTAMLAGVLTDYDYLEAASAARIPILMLRCGRDPLVNAGLTRTIAVMRPNPNFTLVDIPPGGHCANLDATDAFRAALLAFLARVSPAPER